MNEIFSELNVHELELLVGPANTLKPLMIYQQMLLNVLTQLNKQTRLDEQWLISVAHQLKSSARQLKLVSLAESAEQLESALLTNHAGPLQIDDFKLQVTYSYDALAAFLVANKLDK